MNRDDRKRLKDLRDRNEMADLEILSRTPIDILSNLDPEALTTGQLILIAELVSAYNTLTSAKLAQDVSKAAERLSGSAGQAGTKQDVYASPATSERRSFTGGGFKPTEDNDPFGVTDSEAESREAARKLVAEIFGRNFTSDEAMVNTVDGPVSTSAIPRDASGRIDPMWVADHCPCPEHEKERQTRETIANDEYDRRSGLYL